MFLKNEKDIFLLRVQFRKLLQFFHHWKEGLIKRSHQLRMVLHFDKVLQPVFDRASRSPRFLVFIHLLVLQLLDFIQTRWHLFQNRHEIFLVVHLVSHWVSFRLKIAYFCQNPLLERSQVSSPLILLEMKTFQFFLFFRWQILTFHTLSSQLFQSASIVRCKICLWIWHTFQNIIKFFFLADSKGRWRLQFFR